MRDRLVRRGGIWWARLVVPKRLRHAAGRWEFFQSCRTHELVIAKLVAAVLLADWRRQLLGLDSRSMSVNVLKLVEGSPALSGAGWVTVADAVAYSGISQDQLMREAGDGTLKLFCRMARISGVVVPIGSLGLQLVVAVGGVGNITTDPEPRLPDRNNLPPHSYPDTCSGAVPIFDSSELAQRVLTSGLPDVAVSILHKDNFSVFVSDLPMVVPVARLELLLADVESMRQRMARHVLPDTIKREQELRRTVDHSKGALRGKKAHKRFSEALAAFAKQVLPQSNKNPKERERIRRGIELFVELVGDLTLSEIDGDVLRAFRDGPLATVPAKLNHAETRFKTTGVKSSIAAIRASGEPWPTMSAPERDQRMSWICRFFGWLKGDWLVEDPSLSLRGVSVLTKSEQKNAKQAKKARQQFSSDELKLIFSQSWFSTGNGKTAEATSVNRKWCPMEFWLPLLSLHAGQRIRELCQLRLTDVRQTAAGVWYVDINESTPDKSLKNGESQRVVPVHQALIDAGLIEWCDRLRLEGFRRVFPELTWGPTTGYTQEAKRRMSLMLLELGMPRDNTRTFHSLRHTANNAFIRLELAMKVPEKIRLRVLGHKAGNDEGSTTYFSDFEADETASYVNLLAFNLPPIAKFDCDAGIQAIRSALARKHHHRRGVEDMGASGAA